MRPTLAIFGPAAFLSYLDPILVLASLNSSLDVPAHLLQVPAPILVAAMSGGVLEIPAFVIGVAGVFTSCIDAFSYFRLYQDATRDIEVVLLKLDIEKARLLIWGENVGILSANHRNSRLLDERMAELIKQILIQIQELLTDSETLRTSYGVRSANSPLSRAVDYISAKSLAIFQPSASRFLTRNATRLEEYARGSRAARARWAIHEREKFQGLVLDLGHFVDRLFGLTEMGREAPDRTIVEDIESIMDVSRLGIVEDATESYPVYCEAARSAKASTEAGTLDRRTTEEHIRDVESIGAVDPTTRAGDPHKSESGMTTLTSPSLAGTFRLGPNKVADCETDSILSEIQFHEKYFVLTSPCGRMATDQPCDVRLLGSQVRDMVSSDLGYQIPRWDISSLGKMTSNNTLAGLLDRAMGVRKTIRDRVESSILCELLRLGTTDIEGDATDEQKAFIEAKLPLVILSIYCSPCVCLIHTGLSICRRIRSPYVKVQLRPDSRLVSRCCSTVDRSLGMRSLSESVREWESTAKEHQSETLAAWVDMVWLEQRLEHLDYEQPYKFQDPTDARLVYLILGEAEYTTHMVQKAPGRIPKVTDIWHFPRQFGPTTTTTRNFVTRFIERESITERPALPRVQPTSSSTTAMPLYPTTLPSQITGLKRPASPSSSTSASRRQRYETESTGADSETGGQGSTRSEDGDIRM
jgi:hypothetical protein